MLDGRFDENSCVQMLAPGGKAPEWPFNGYAAINPTVSSCLSPALPTYLGNSLLVQLL
jgi:hypothetical protein